MWEEEVIYILRDGAVTKMVYSCDEERNNFSLGMFPIPGVPRLCSVKNVLGDP